MNEHEGWETERKYTAIIDYPHKAFFERWEKRLRSFYNQGLGFIGEIPISYSEMEEMADETRALIKDSGLGYATEFLYFDYPRFLLTLMATFAAYNTQQNYWQAFAESIGVDKQYLYNQRWHKRFVRQAQKCQLKVFDFGDDPNPYVTSIRFQGGIPSYSLPDYFERMVLPAVERRELREAPVKETLSYLIEHAYFVDSPVLDFLKNSGELGEQFFNESCKLARYALDHHGAMLPENKVDLPEYVINKFADWWERREDISQHWTKPYLQVDPYSDDTAVFLRLPQQEITLDLAASRIYWHIQFPQTNQFIERPCRVSRSRQNVVTQDDILPITQPIQSIEISLTAVQMETDEEVELRCWHIPFMPAEGAAPLAAFNSKWILLPNRRQLPADVIYLLTPLNCDLVFEGKAHEIEELLPLTGGWREWKVKLFDLRQAWSIQLIQDNKPLGEAIPIQGSIPQPELIGGHLFQFQDQDIPLYTSGLPDLQVPLSKGSSQQTRLSGWQVHVRSIGETAPQIDKTFQFVQLADLIKEEDGWGKLSLHRLIGENAAGIYWVRVSGPRGLGGEFRFRAWPKLLVIGHSMQLAPPERDPQPSQFNLRLQDGASVETQSGYDDVFIRSTDPIWQVTVPPNYNRVELFLITTAEQGGRVRVPLTIPLPRLCWSLATEREQVEWGQSILRRSIDQILQSGHASIHLEMYGLGTLPGSMRIQLMDLSELEKIAQEAKLFQTDFSKNWMRVGIDQFLDTMRSINSIGRFDLVYLPPSDTPYEIRYPLIEVSRALEISDLNLRPLDETTWQLTWQEDRPVRNRRVMITPNWQPWQQPWEYKIPNDSRGELILENISLPATQLHLFFYVRSEDQEPLKETPEGITPHTIDLCPAEDRLAEIPEDSASDNERFKNLIEKAAIYDSLGNINKRDEVLSVSAKSLIHLSNLSLLTSSLHWIKPRDIFPPIKSFFFNKMFSCQIVESMLKNYTAHDPSRVEYLSFINDKTNIPIDSAKLLLRHVDDPAVLRACLLQLLTKRDSELAQIVVQMIIDYRLSPLDGVELFSKAPLWSLEYVSEIDSNSSSDRLIAGLLPQIAQMDEAQQHPGLSEWIYRALPFEENGQFIEKYFEVLFAEKHPSRFEKLLQMQRDEKISNEDCERLLSIDPTASLAALAAFETEEQGQLWMDWLSAHFPAAAGFLTIGSKIRTPFGKASVTKIETSEPSSGLEKTRLGEKGLFISAILMIEHDEFNLQIDFNKMRILLGRYKKIWKCSSCGFYHPDSNKAIEHSSHDHGVIKISAIDLPMSFSDEEIQLIPEEV